MPEPIFDLTGRPMTYILPLNIKKRDFIRDPALVEDVAHDGLTDERDFRGQDTPEKDFHKIARQEKDCDVQEERELQEKLEKYCRFFAEGFQTDGLPSRQMEDFNTLHREWYDDLVFRRLRKDLKNAREETGPTKYRSWSVVQEYWDNVREELDIDDSELSESDLPIVGFETKALESSTPGAVVRDRGWQKPARFCPSSGRDLQLMEVRKMMACRKKS